MSKMIKASILMCSMFIFSNSFADVKTTTEKTCEACKLSCKNQNSTVTQCQPITKAGLAQDKADGVTCECASSAS